MRTKVLTRTGYILPEFHGLQRTFTWATSVRWSFTFFCCQPGCRALASISLWAEQPWKVAVAQRKIPTGCARSPVVHIVLEEATPNDSKSFPALWSKLSPLTWLQVCSIESCLLLPKLPELMGNSEVVTVSFALAMGRQSVNALWWATNILEPGLVKGARGLVLFFKHILLH